VVLGYEVETVHHPLDEKFPDGPSVPVVSHFRPAASCGDLGRWVIRWVYRLPLAGSGPSFRHTQGTSPA
jgi:hypothetical protein